ncbi:hypothetical protein [Actinokineospora inagensis]|uniref:hypothetical protein n=1 Tax=Actinokineospora inagensis TaxID=103730 RepID=UPI00040C6B85|nr:hypothetical protein [Actinokineospora inagensis]
MSWLLTNEARWKPTPARLTWARKIISACGGTDEDVAQWVDYHHAVSDFVAHGGTLPKPPGDAEKATAEEVAAEIRHYLGAVIDVLGRTMAWLPDPDIDANFEQRMVTAWDEIPERRVDGGPSFGFRDTRQGDVSWNRAVEEVAVAVVLADAGYGKTWLLRHHGRQLARSALAALESGAPVDELVLPLFTHAAELAAHWAAGKAPSNAVLGAAMLPLRESGFTLDARLRDYLEDRLLGEQSGVHVLVDAWDEVFDDDHREAARQAVRWLHGLVVHPGGPRLVLASRPTGYSDPFGVADADGDLEYSAPRYFELGVLAETQVRHLWRAWFRYRGQPLPEQRLLPAIAPRSPLRRFVHVPLIAAFCAWVAEEETVAQTRSELYRQVLGRFLSRQWKPGSTPSGSPHQDPAHRGQLHRALMELAWHMAAGGSTWRRHCARGLRDDPGGR